MAMNNISFLVSSEKDSLLAFKDNSLANGGENLGDEFLSQLNEAHNSMEPLLKGNKNPDAENSIAIPKHKQPEENENLSVKLDEVITDEVTFVSVEMLDQINSAQAMSTSVNKPFDATNSLESENAELEATLVENTELQSTPIIASTNTSDEVSAKEANTASVVQNPIATNVDSKTAKLTDSKSDNFSSPPLNSLPLNEGKHRKSGVAEAIEGPLNSINKKPDDSIGPILEKPEFASTMISKEQLGQNKSADKNNIVLPTPTDKAGVTQSSLAATEADNNAAIDTLMTKDESLIKANDVIASLTPEQRSQLNAQVKVLENTDSTSNATSSTSNLKQMLAQFITDNEKTQSTVTKHSFSAEINSLNTTEKQSLLTQLNAYIKTEQPKGEQLAVLKQTVNELKASIEIGLADTAKTDSKTFVASETPNTVYNPQKLSLKTSTNEGADLNKAVTTSTKGDDLLKSLEELQKDGLKKITAEQTPARVAQVFTQITAALNTQQVSTLSQYDSLSYEQSLLDTQIIQTQQLQSTSQVKQVSIDPGVMQAINIVKSDAAKLLQERVSSMLSINNKEAEIRLDPPEMGSMQIRIRSDAEQAHINFVVQNQQAKEALEQSMPRLREMLAQQGLELGESTISYGQSGGETAEQSESGPQGNLANNKSVNDENDEQANNTAQSSRQQTSSSIDYYA
ncbi:MULTISPECIES: flagellar hook-length control protein FliK [Pseudoalteromonas]|uniref:flagellar hook-length control protein FliK n=1 Tax=Pseudoalteromonas TaxID=53246 RepID=UPI000C31F9C9|nr:MULTISPECIES: flagellar hook-length control protein FliK [Pseudoalteromonas]PKG66459.1 flagellar hook-length control protein FliK [Pseudoalteromonas arctica]PKG71104.1 flagellar hook-length control protein FliK [Pseudoalteromonas sp. GutCa3]